MDASASAASDDVDALSSFSPLPSPDPLLEPLLVWPDPEEELLLYEGSRRRAVVVPVGTSFPPLPAACLAFLAGGPPSAARRPAAAAAPEPVPAVARAPSPLLSDVAAGPAVPRERDACSCGGSDASPLLAPAGALAVPVCELQKLSNNDASKTVLSGCPTAVSNLGRCGILSTAVKDDGGPPPS